MVGLAALGGFVAGRRMLRATTHPDLALRAGTHLLQRTRRVLALGAWPGDLEREVGGFLWRCQQAGASVVVAVAPPPPSDRANADEVTRREMEQAQAILGYEQADLLPPAFGAGSLPGLIQAVQALWARENPDLVLLPAAGMMATGRRSLLEQAVLVVAEQRGEAQKLALYGTAMPNVLVDVSRALEMKWQGLRAYQSALIGPDGLHQWQLRRSAARFGRQLPSYGVEGLYRLC